ncbi:MAG: hypothetical protein AAGF53_15840 [Pseudomonadota bacterium]
MAELISQADVEGLFTRADGSYLFARWGRPIAPVVFGTDDATLSVVKGAVEAVVQMAGHSMTETDPELGANLMFFFFKDWDELPEVKGMDRLVPDLLPLVEKLKSSDANQYRIFRFDEEGAIKASFVFLRMDKELSSIPADTLALGQVAQTIVLWSDTAFLGRSILATTGRDQVILRPDIGAVVRAGYDPVMPAMAQDPSHALRLSARIGGAQ